MSRENNEAAVNEANERLRRIAKAIVRKKDKSGKLYLSYERWDRHHGAKPSGKLRKDKLYGGKYMVWRARVKREKDGSRAHVRDGHLDPLTRFQRKNDGPRKKGERCSATRSPAS